MRLLPSRGNDWPVDAYAGRLSTIGRLTAPGASRP